MHSYVIRFVFVVRLVVVIAMAAGATGCSVESQTAPTLAGPSELSLSVALSATPDVLPRDGSSRSVIVATVRGPQAEPKAGQRLRLSASAGLLSAADVVTGADGRATFEFTAPSVNQGVTSASINVTPVGDNSLNSVTQVVFITLTGPSVPVAAFTQLPPSPARLELATFDASTSTLAGVTCGASCAYSWAFGTEATASGQIVQYRFQSQALYNVTLTVTSPVGTFSNVTKTVTVGALVAPTAKFTFSPTNPRAIVDTVFFNASTSTAANGATLTEYRWDFGDGVTATTTTPTTSTTFASARTFNVSLTVVDNNGQTHNVVTPVTVAP